MSDHATEFYQQIRLLVVSASDISESTKALILAQRLLSAAPIEHLFKIVDIAEEILNSNLSLNEVKEALELAKFINEFGHLPSHPADQPANQFNDIPTEALNVLPAEPSSPDSLANELPNQTPEPLELTDEERAKSLIIDLTSNGYEAGVIARQIGKTPQWIGRIVGGYPTKPLDPELTREILTAPWDKIPKKRFATPDPKEGLSPTA